MECSKQIDLLRGVIQDYQNDLMRLGVLIQKIEGVFEILDDPEFKNSLFDDFLALEEVYARTRNGNFDFDIYGKSIVDRALKQISEKIAFT